MNLEALKAAIMKRRGKDIDIDALLAALMPNEGEEAMEGDMEAGADGSMLHEAMESPEKEAGEEAVMADEGKDLAPDLAAAPAKGTDDMAQMVAKMMASRGKKPQASVG